VKLVGQEPSYFRTLSVVSSFAAACQSCYDNDRDGVTEDQNPIIARHPNYANLLIACEASYTYAKDRPHIGLVVAGLLKGDEAVPFGWAILLTNQHFAQYPISSLWSMVCLAD